MAKDKFVTILQFVAITFFLVHQNINYNKIIWLLALSTIPAIWAYCLQNRFFSIYPMPLSGAKLIVRGPYRYVRHPMYSSIILFCLVILISDFSYFLLLKYFFIIFIIAYKVQREEIYLEKTFAEYISYKKKTKFVIPFLL